jgi:methanogenic corrinoid protein MtbC1
METLNIADAQNEFRQALLLGNRIKGSAILRQFIEQKIPLPELYESIIKKSLYQVGELWEYNKITVADEHIATAVTEALLNDFYQIIISNSRTGHKVVVGCVENEMHQVGIKMVADIFEMNGWDAYFLGANIPTSELIKYIHQVKPHVVALSVSIYFHIPILEKMIAEIRKAFPILTIIVGGQAFRHGSDEIFKIMQNVFYLHDLHSIELFILKYHENDKS